MKFKDQIINELEKTIDQVTSAKRGMELRQITPERLYDILDEINKRSDNLLTLVRREP